MLALYQRCYGTEKQADVRTYLAVTIVEITVILLCTTEENCFKTAAGLASARYRVPGKLRSHVMWSPCFAFGQKSHKDMADLVKENVGEHEDESSKTSVFVVAGIVGPVCPSRCLDHIVNSLSECELC